MGELLLLLLTMALHSSETGSVSLWKQGHSSTELCGKIEECAIVIVSF